MEVFMTVLFTVLSVVFLIWGVTFIIDEGILGAKGFFIGLALAFDLISAISYWYEVLDLNTDDENVKTIEVEKNIDSIDCIDLSGDIQKKLNMGLSLENIEIKEKTDSTCVMLFTFKEEIK